MLRILSYCLLAHTLIDRASTTLEEPQFTFEDLYQYGKYEYTDGNWQDCVGFMRRALDDFQYYEDELVWCRRKCNQQIEPPELFSLSQMHAKSERALCLLRCKRDRFTENRPPLKKMTTYFDMMERKPYQYMHICYWKMGELDNAVKSAYTFLVKNPTHKDTLDGIAFYMEQKGYKDEMLVDALRRPYEEKFISGVKAYNEEDWNKCVDDLETSLDKTLEEDSRCVTLENFLAAAVLCEKYSDFASVIVNLIKSPRKIAGEPCSHSLWFRCRLLCEDKIDWSVVEGNPELDVLMTSIQASVVRCQHNCLYRLALINGHNVGNLIAAHFEHLHFCYYKLMRGSDAARSVANYLLFDDNPLVRRNKYFYRSQYNKEELFTPDERMLDLYKQRTLEQRYLDFIDEKFKYVNNEFPPEMQDDRKKFDTFVGFEDDFDYSAIRRLLSQSECKVLRSAFPVKEDKTLEELTDRVRALWPKAVFEERNCSRESRQTTCSRAIVLSIENDDCSEWLGAMHTGCSIVFCA